MRLTSLLGIEAHDGKLLLSLRPRDKLSLGRQLEDISSALAGVPDGTALEIVYGSYGDEEPEGKQRYRGYLSGGIWTITQAYPRLSCSVFARAIDFSAYFEEGQVKAQTADEAERILGICRDFDERWVKTIGLIRKGDILELTMEDAGELWNVARFAFATQFSDTWPAWEWWDCNHPEGRPDASSAL